MSFTLDAFRASLSEASDSGAGGPYCVALSGGLDSTVALHAMVECAGAGEVRAVHVDHGLHPDSREWGEHCARLCSTLGVRFDNRIVAIEAGRGESPEAAARDARYAALRAALDDGETLVTGHHADDQLETVILQLMRGAGTAGLAAMPSVTRFPPGFLCRPLLAWTRAELLDWARSLGTQWLEDPSNRELGFDRNYLRHEVLPALVGRWPAAAKSAVRSARLCAEATVLTEALAALDLEESGSGDRVRVESLLGMPPARTRNLLRFWLARAVGRAPDSRKLETIVTDLLPARPDASPQVLWADGAVRRYRGELYALDRQTLERLALRRKGVSWAVAEPLALGPGFGSISISRRDGKGLDPAWLESGALEVRFRAGGERIRPVGRPHTRPVKKLFQEAGIPPWWREHVPMFYDGERLLAVGDFWIEDTACREGAGNWCLEWRSRPDAIVVPPVIW